MIAEKTNAGSLLKPVSNAAIVLFVVLSGFAMQACEKSPDLSRKEYLMVCDSVGGKVISLPLSFRLDDNKDTLYVYSNVDYAVEFITDDADQQWITLENKGRDAKSGADIYFVHYKERGYDYLYRYGTINFTYPSAYLGQFVKVRQGMKSLVHDGFEWLLYGTADPYDTAAEKAIGDWSATQKEKGWTGSGVYGKNGFLRLGTDTAGGNLVTPQVSDINRDSIYMVRFDAVAYCGENGVKDGNTLSVSVINGGEFLDGTLEKEIKPAFFDSTKDYSEPGNSIWNTGVSNTFFLYFTWTETNKITQLTQIKFEVKGGENRVFLYNIAIHALDEATYYLVED